MGYRQVLLFGFVLACIRLCDARFFTRRARAYMEDEAQILAKPAAVPEKDLLSQHAGRPQKKLIQTELETLTWKYPELPEDPVEKKPPLKFELRRPVITNRVAVRCWESTIQVEVSQDLMGLGKLAEPEEVKLGGCAAIEVDTMSHVLVFESELHSCGSRLVVMDYFFVYAFSLIYKPNVTGRGQIIRRSGATFELECHYPRQIMSISPFSPAWKPNIEEESEGRLHFSLQLMTDDWESERPSNRYTVGDILNMQASVLPYGNTSLRVLVDSCVAASRPTSSLEPRRDFIKNNGCLGDRGSPRSRFMPQSQSDHLWFQVEAVSVRLFGTIFITCQLKAIPASSAFTLENKACSIDDSGWWAVSGEDQVCACCDSTCGIRKSRDVGAHPEEQWRGEVTLGPIFIVHQSVTPSIF